MTSPSSPGASVLRADDPLTTKEGWRRFTEHQPQPPELLAEAELGALTAAGRADYDEARKDYHAGLPMVNTPVIQKVIATSRLLIQLNRHQVSARRGVIISGASGTGKTTALTQLGRTHELRVRKRYPGDPYRLPSLYVTVPPAATARMLAVEFARFLGLEFTTRANITDIVNAVCATAAHTRVELVCIDEIHNLNLATRTGADVSDQLKYFAEWRSLAAGDTAQRQQVIAEIGRRLGRPGYQPPDTGNAIAHWIEYDSWQPPSQPTATYLQTRDHGTARPAAVSQQILQRQDRSAAYFALNRRGGNVILHHRHIRPVLVRDWSPAMDGITATIWASQATGHPASWTPARPPTAAGPDPVITGIAAWTRTPASRCVQTYPAIPSSARRTRNLKPDLAHDHRRSAGSLP